MGGVVSTGQDNDDLIDNLKEAEYIKTAKVEQVFRIVDRAHYYLPESRDNAYKDLAWKSGTLHLSAPCIYSEVMEALDLKQGLSFLNLGSGTGYLNTMVGFMIGPYGINHGIELHADNVEYSEERLKKFMEKSKKFDDVEFGVPTFVKGNCLNLAPDNRRYDRVYCGAACPPDLKSAIQNLLKIGGILVMPVGDQLLRVKRVSDMEFTADNVLPVSFASLCVPPASKEPTELIIMPEVNPVSLQNQCAIVIRNAIRQNFCFDIETTDAKSKQKKKTKNGIFQQENVRLPLNFLPTAQRLMIMGAFGHSDDSNNSDDDQTDDSLLDLQLHRHARERQREEERRRRERSKGNTDDIDSSLSDEEMDEEEDENGINIKSRQTNSKDKSSCHELKSSSVYVESMESEDGIVADDEGDEEDELDDDDELKDLSYRVGKKQKGSNGSNRSSRSLSVDEHPSDNKKDVSGAHKGVMSTMPLSSDEEEQLVANVMPSSSGPIQVVTSPYPRRYKTSYSTSAEASETSGFGSLGDDTFHIGSLQSNSVFCDSRDEDGDITDELSLDDAGVFMNDQTDTQNIQRSPVLKSSRNMGHVSSSSHSHGNKTIEEEDMDENENGFERHEPFDDHHTSTDEDDLTSSEEDDGDAIGDDTVDRKIKYTPTEPRGPDFTAFLRKQVETLPIPNSLKLFILRYR